MPTIIPIPYSSNSTSHISNKDAMAAYITLTAISLIIFLITYGLYLWKKHIKKDIYACFCTGFFDSVIYVAWIIITALILFFKIAEYISNNIL